MIECVKEIKCEGSIGMVKGGRKPSEMQELHASLRCPNTTTYQYPHRVNTRCVKHGEVIQYHIRM